MFAIFCLFTVLVLAISLNAAYFYLFHHLFDAISVYMQEEPLFKRKRCKGEHIVTVLHKYNLDI